MSATLQLNGLDVVEADIQLPRIGVWGARLVLDTDSAPTGRCTLAWEDGLTLVGSAFRSGVSDGSVVVSLLGGNGGLWKVFGPRAYRTAPLSLPLNDLLQGAGESLSSTVDPELLSQTLPFWVVQQDSGSRNLFSLLDGLNVGWRMLLDGTLWIGVESWPNADDFEFDVLEDNPAENRLTLAAETPTLLPGQVFEGGHVSYVHYSLKDSKTRTQVWMEDA